MNDAFTGPFWNLDQVLAWIETRDPELVRFASASKQTGRIRNTYEIAVQANRTATETKKAAGRDINAELWAISGWAKPTHLYPTPMAEERLAEELGVPPYLLASYKNIAVQWPLQQEAVALLNAWLTASPVEQQVLTGLFKFHQTEDSILSDTSLTRLSAEMRQLLVAYISRREAHGPPHIVRLDPFPTIEYLQRLFCVGNLKAIGNLPNDPIGRVIEAKDWGGLEIAVGGELRRLGVWRLGNLRNDGHGDIEHVRVAREEVLREFLAEPPRAKASEPAPFSDGDARKLILAAMDENGGFIAQEAGAEIVLAAAPGFGKKRAMNLVRSLTKNDKPGPKGPRKNCAANRA